MTAHTDASTPIVEGDRNPHLVQHAGEDAIGDQFTIDEHAVAIKNDQIKPAFFHLAAASCHNMLARRLNILVQPDADSLQDHPPSILHGDSLEEWRRHDV